MRVLVRSRRRSVSHHTLTTHTISDLSCRSVEGAQLHAGAALGDEKHSRAQHDCGAGERAVSFPCTLSAVTRSHAAARPSTASPSPSAHWYLGIICYPSLVCISEEQSQAAAAAQSKAAAAAAAKSKTPEAKSKTAAASAAKTKAAAAPTTWKKPGIVDSFIQAERRNDNTDSDQDEVDDDEEELASVLQRPRANAGGTATAAAAAANRGNSASSAAPMDVDSNVPVCMAWPICRSATLLFAPWSVSESPLPHHSRASVFGARRPNLLLLP